MTVRSIGALEWFPNVRWIRSFVIDEPGRLETLCAYEASSVEELRATNLRCAVPFAEIRPVVEVLHESSPLGNEDGDLYLVSSRSSIGTWQTATLLRSYIDEERGNHATIVRAPLGTSSFDTHDSAVDSVTAVTEIHPSEWAWVYESLNVPKHWELESART